MFNSLLFFQIVFIVLSIAAESSSFKFYILNKSNKIIYKWFLIIMIFPF